MKIQSLVEGQVDLVPWRIVSPERCRVILANCTASKIIGIERIKPGRQPYVVLPGGGVEPTDTTPLNTIAREVKEETGLREADYHVAEKGIIINDEYGSQFVFLAEVTREIEGLVMSGPELGKPMEENGTYRPRWYSLADIGYVGLVPACVRDALVRGWDNESETATTKDC